MNAKKMFQMTVIPAIFALLIVGCSTAAAKEAEETIEIPASNINFLVGVWEIEVDKINYRMEFTSDGIQKVGMRAAPQAFVNGPFHLEGNRLIDESMPACTAEYDVTIVLEPGAEMPGLHFELVGEDCEASRQEALDGKTLYPYPPADF